MLDTPGVIASKKELKEAKTFKLVFAKDKGGTAGSRGHAREEGGPCNSRARTQKQHKNARLKDLVPNDTTMY